MQQGVMETPLYNGFMLKGSISAHAHNFNSHISKAFEAVDKKTKRQLYKAHHRMHVSRPPLLPWQADWVCLS